MKKLVVRLLMVLFVPLVAQAEFTGAAEVVLWYYVTASGPLLLPDEIGHPWRVGVFPTRAECVESGRVMQSYVIVPCGPAGFRETTITPWHG